MTQKRSLSLFLSLPLAAVALTGCAASLGARSPTQPASYWIGDSYTADYVASDTAGVLGWHGYLDAEGSTGFVATGHALNPAYDSLPARLAADVKALPHPDVVVIDAGRNDQFVPAAGFHRAVESYFRALAKAYPSAAVVVIAPYEMRSKAGDFLAMRRFLIRQARHRHWAFVDPIAEGWIDAASAKLVISDGVHPSPQGAQYVADHLGPAIKRALEAAHESVG